MKKENAKQSLMLARRDVNSLSVRYRSVLCLASLAMFLFGMNAPLFAVRASSLPSDVFILSDEGDLRDENGNLSPALVTKKFYETHPDDYDFLAIYTNFSQNGQRYDYEVPVRRNISGIGEDAVQDSGERYGSAKRLLQVTVFHDIAPPGSEYFSLNIGDILHEMSHYWLAYVTGVTRDPDIQLGFGAHWSKFFDTSSREDGKLYLSPNRGSPWKEAGSGTYINDVGSVDAYGMYHRFNWFEMYLMGFASKSEIRPMNYIKTEGDTFLSPDGSTDMVRGTLVTLSPDDLISTIGTRSPSYPESKKDFRVGYILVLAEGTEASEQALKRLRFIADQFPVEWYEATRGRSTINGITPSPAQTPSPAPVSVPTPSPVPTPEPAPAAPAPDSSSDVISRERARLTRVDTSLVNRLKGQILLQTESRGEAWYVDPINLQRVYIRNGADAYGALKTFGLGITNSDLASIPVGIDEGFRANDTDGDGLPDVFEEALGTSLVSADTDGDGFPDMVEIQNGYNPKGVGVQARNKMLVERLAGRILLQVEGKGEAWYLHPVDGKRYYMNNGEAAYSLMRLKSLGISNGNLSAIPLYAGGIH